jgi:hypothetical protein
VVGGQPLGLLSQLVHAGPGLKLERRVHHRLGLGSSAWLLPASAAARSLRWPIFNAGFLPAVLALQSFMAVSLWVAGFRFSKLDSHELTAETAAFKFQLRVGHRH